MSTAVKVILRDDVDGLGNRGRSSSRSPRATSATSSNPASPRHSGHRRSRGPGRVDAQGPRPAAMPAARESAEEIATVHRLQGDRDRDAAPAEAGRLFGSVTTAEIVAAVAEQTGIEIDRKALLLEDHIKERRPATTSRPGCTPMCEFPITIEVARTDHRARRAPSPPSAACRRGGRRLVPAPSRRPGAGPQRWGTGRWRRCRSGDWVSDALCPARPQLVAVDPQAIPRVVPLVPTAPNPEDA